MLIRRRWLVAAVAIACAAGARPAEAAVTDIQYVRLEGVDGYDLPDRIGALSTATEHVINLEDCRTYAKDGAYINLYWSAIGTPAAGTKYAVKISKPGGSCSTSETTMEDNDSTCLKTMQLALPDPPNNVKVLLYLPELTGDCTATMDAQGLDTNVYIILDEGETGGTAAVTSETVAFRIDLKGPNPVKIDELKEGDSNLKASWTDDQNEGEDGIEYRVYWSTSPLTDANKANAESSDDLTATSYQITGLENGRMYYVGVTALDENDNESALPDTAITTGMPVEVEDFFDLYKGAGGREDGGFCFIATAAYGSYMADDVVTLRLFRDRYLMATAPGRLLVDAYYAVSPPIADAIAGSETARAVTRVALWPLVWLAGAAVALPGAAGAALLLLPFLAWAAGAAVALARMRRAAHRGRRP